MLQFKKILLTVATIAAAAVVSYAQPEHNDTLRTSTWSVYLQGGVSGFHGMNGTDNQYDRDKNYLAPALDFGVLFHPRPWLRLGLDFGYTYLKSADPGILTNSYEMPNVQRGGYTGTLSVNSARIQNRNFTNAVSSDLTMGINFVEIWRERQDQWFNIWLSVGGGYMHGWNRYTTTWAYDETLLASGSGYHNLYEHSYIESNSKNNQFDTFYIPAGLSFEFDVIPQLTLAAYGQYKYFPLRQTYTPTGIWSAGLAIRLNFVGKKQGFTTKDDKINMLKDDVAEYEKYIGQMRDENASLNATNKALKDERNRLQDELAEKNAQAALPAQEPEIKEVEKPISNYAVQIMAFKIYQHTPQDKIFHGDNPVIYKNGKLRRYVIFTSTLEAAEAKLAEVKPRYHDAFIVTIEEDGTVKPVKPVKTKK